MTRLAHDVCPAAMRRWWWWVGRVAAGRRRTVSPLFARQIADESADVGTTVGEEKSRCRVLVAAVSRQTGTDAYGWAAVLPVTYRRTSW